MIKNYSFLLVLIGCLFLGRDVEAQKLQSISNPNQKWISPSIKTAPSKLFVRFKEANDVNYAYMESGQPQFVSSEKQRLYKLLTDARVKSVLEPMSVLKNSVSDVLQITLYNDNDLERYRNELSKDKNVMYVESVPLPQTFADPNDPLFSDQYHINLVGAIDAWSKKTDNPNAPKNDIVLAIVDDGVLITHEDLVANIFINEGETPNNGKDDDGNGYIDDYNGWDASGTTYENGDPDPTPPEAQAGRFTFSHGTHCAGIAGAVTNNGIGVTSVSNNGIKILAVKATSDDTPSARAITHSTEALMYAIAMEADVVSMSFGSYFYSATVSRMIDEATEDGMLFIAAAGNDNVNLASYPAGYNNVIAVANTTSNDVKSPSSQYGSWIDISAPGTDIISTVAADNGNPKGDYAPYTGTSMSCPLVAGAAAFLKTQDSTLSPIQLKALLLGTATDINPRNPGYQNSLGAGRINMDAAMDALLANRPLAAFNILSDNGILNQELEFENLSIGNGLTYEWNFGDSQKSNATTDTVGHTYTDIPDLGSYIITLTVTDSQGRKNTFRRGIQMTEGPPSSPIETVPFATDFLLDTGGFVTETVFLDGGSGNDIWEHARARGNVLNSGDSSVWVTTSGGGVPFRSFSAILYTPTFDLTTANREYKIHFTKSMDITYCNAPAACQMQYTIDNGGTWKLLGEANDGLGTGWYNKSPNDACAIHPIIFQDQAGWLGNFDNDSTSYNVSFLAGEQVRFRFVYRHESAFQIQDTDDGFMVRDFEVTSEVPTGEFTSPSIVEYINRPLDFIYNSGGATTYAWNFGDGNTSTDQNPTHTYTTAGNYFVSLEVDGNTASNYQDTIAILGEKKAPFYPSDGGDLETNELLFYPYNLAGNDLKKGNSTIDGKSGTTSGDSAYVLGPDTTAYEVPTGFYLYTSVFDLPGDSNSGDSTQMFSFNIKQDVANKVDGMYTEYSDDYGKSWSPLGYFIDPSWTNAFSSEDYWGGEGIPLITGSTNNNWETKFIPLAGFEGEQLAFRLFFVGANADSSGGIGLALDDFRVVPYNPQVTSLSYSVDKTEAGLNQEITFTNTSDADTALIGWYFGEEGDALPSIAYGAGPHEVSYTTEGSKSIAMFVIGSTTQKEFQNAVRIDASITSLEEEIVSNSPIIFPNPGEGNQLHILSDQLIDKVEIYKSTGQVMGLSQKFVNGVMDVSKLPPGVYILKLQQHNGEIYHKKFIKK
ncbi:PKD domain-containing protein [Flammeovirga pectinis]|uniref:PKD domain-containing protein n=1 Tax=Flammeovirga pectinis TaxID=2494373 RepID=A0A3S9NXM1_9BACT|nr:S8 family serine peptidase [Flammeovirga pectinis]AZQ60703.1 PKD domain-containing protein [Flammeovirga pectinis]